MLQNYMSTAKWCVWIYCEWIVFVTAITVILTQFFLYSLITAESLTVQVLDSTIFNTGDNLNLTCLVSADDLAALGLEVTWLLNDTQVLTHLSRDGVVAKTSDMFSINRVGEGEFRLEIHSIELSDMGLYSCRVRAWIQQSWGKWYQAAEKTSAPVQVVITPKGELIRNISRVFSEVTLKPRQSKTSHVQFIISLRCPLRNHTDFFSLMSWICPGTWSLSLLIILCICTQVLFCYHLVNSFRFFLIGCNTGVAQLLQNWWAKFRNF